MPASPDQRSGTSLRHAAATAESFGDRSREHLVERRYRAALPAHGVNVVTMY
jgi:hypothetical protein